MKRLLLLLLLCCNAALMLAQEVGGVGEQQLEAITESNGDEATDDDALVQQMQHFLKSPLNLNTADAEALKELQLLSPLQIQHFIAYRQLLGPLMDIYELQAVPSWTLAVIQQLRPFIFVRREAPFLPSIQQRLKDGDHSLLLRMAQILEPSKGFQSTAAQANNGYLGSPQKLLFRYSYQFKKLLQYGLLAEKDAGEQLFKGNEKKGFDFYSAHFFLRHIGVIQALALGDFVVNLGQGLTQWQSLAFKKGAEVINIKRQLPVLRPYHSAGEINFHRGAGITLAKGAWAATAFVSFKKIDANAVNDSLKKLQWVSALQTSGLHRTNSEMADKSIQQQLALGGNIAYQKNAFHLGLNAVQYQFSLPIKKSAEPYNRYAFSGNRLGNYSVDYSYTFKNFHFFGEAALSNPSGKAFVNGLIVSAAPGADLSFLYRNISPQYQSLYTNAFTENSFPNNEKGLYMGLSLRPNAFWRLDGYADFYRFPWLKYAVDLPSTGSDYMLQATYKPNKQLEMYLRYRTENKLTNAAIEEREVQPWTDKPRQNIRLHINQTLSPNMVLRNRVEMVWVNKAASSAQQGFLWYVDALYKPMQKRYSAALRWLYFETDGYDSRLYAYENDVLYSYAIPVFYDKGVRYYVNLHYQLNKKMELWGRWSQTVYPGKTSIGTGLEERQGNKKTEVKLQLRYSF